uniref:F-box domain-containing protein n=1 Tax=Arcella intermedia TaxID=1963864 RepID=A0A6B2L1A7_9EUKA
MKRDNNPPQKIEITKWFWKVLVSFSDIAVGGGHAMLVTDGGELYGFGLNDCGQLGIAPINKIIWEPQMVKYFDEKNIKVKSVECGDKHTLVVDKDKEIWLFGSNEYGQLGLGDSTPKMIKSTHIPQYFNPQGEFSMITLVACGANHTLFVNNKKLYSFGRNDSGQLGHGDFTNRRFPTVVSLLSHLDILHLKAGSDHTLAVNAIGFGLLYSFGCGSSGQLGYPVLEDETNKSCQPKPTLVSLLDKSIVVDVIVGSSLSLVIVEDHDVSEDLISAKLGVFQSIPVEISLMILSYLPALDLISFGGVCRFFTMVSNDNRLWENLVRLRFPMQYKNKYILHAHWKGSYTAEHKKDLSFLRAERKHLATHHKSQAFILKELKTSLIGNVLLLGIEGSGRSTLMAILDLSPITYSSRYGYSFESQKLPRFQIIDLTTWHTDFYKQVKRKYFPQATGLIYLVDSTTDAKFTLARDELAELLGDKKLNNCDILVLANKQDHNNAVPVNEISRALNFPVDHRRTQILGCSTLTGAGLPEAFTWISQKVDPRRIY